VDELGNLFVSGHFQGTANFGGGNLVSAGESDVFVAKFNANGVHQWSQRFGGANNDWGWGIAVDPVGNVVVTGSFRGTVNFGGGNYLSLGASDIFLAKYNTDGVHQWSRRFGGNLWDEGYSVATDAAGNVIVTGYFYGPLNFGGGELVTIGNSDIFLVKFDGNGVHQWSHGYGGGAFEYSNMVAVDTSGSPSVVGHFEETIDLGGGDLVSAGETDIFIAKYDANGVHQWSQRFGGTDFDLGWSLATDASNRVIAAGAFHGTANMGGSDLVSAGANDAFVAVYDAAGAHVWSERFGGISDDESYGVAVDAAGNISLTGYFYNTVNFGGGDLVSAGNDDVFLVQYGDSPASATPYAPLSVMLGQNFPNPFNPMTTIEYTLTTRTAVAIEIFDASGTLVKRLDHGVHEAGTHQVQWDVRDSADRPVASGIYFYRLAGMQDSATRKMVLLK
jgi:hypothetical protein